MKITSNILSGFKEIRRYKRLIALRRKELYFRNDLARNKKLLDFKGNNERIFILATGPSINNVDIKVLRHEDTLAVSSFYKHKDIHYINPKYYFDAPTHYLNGEDRTDQWEKYFSEIDTVGLKSKYIFSITDKHLLESNNLFHDKEVFYYLPLPSVSEITGVWNINLNNAVESPQTSTVLALTICLYLGYKKIFLLGCDHDDLVKGYYQRFYGDYVEGGPEDYMGDREYLLNCYLIVWRQYKKIKKIAQKMGVEIINLNPQSFLDVFPQRKFEDIIKVHRFKNSQITKEIDP